MSTLPPRKVHNARERLKMVVDWVNLELDRISLEDFIHKQSTFFTFTQSNGAFDVEKYFTLRKQAQKQAEYGTEIYAAEHGDIEPLRRRHPLIAEFINLPPKSVGQHFLKFSWARRNQAVVQDVKLARVLLKKYCKDHHLRKGDVPTAVQIAADRWEVDENEIVNWEKNPPPKRNPPSNRDLAGFNCGCVSF
jgi:hypothetical protein